MQIELTANYLALIEYALVLPFCFNVLQTFKMYLSTVAVFHLVCLNERIKKDFQLSFPTKITSIFPVSQSGSHE